MEHPSIWRVAAPAVISETIEDEAIIINLDSGAYYSLESTGAAIWLGVQAGWPAAAISADLAARYAGEPAAIAAAVNALLVQLRDEALIVPAETGEPVDAVAAPALPAASRPLFVAPVLQKYTDMADLLLLDPIHEVNEQGWPYPAPRV